MEKEPSTTRLPRPFRRPVSLSDGVSEIASPALPQAAGSRLLQAIFNQSGVGIAVVDRDGRFLEINRRMAEIVGRDPEELRGLACSDVTHPDDWACCRLLIEQVVQGERSEFTAEKRYVRPDGSWAWANISVSPYQDEAGELRLVALVEDVTARQRAEASLRESEARFRHVADHAPVLIWVNDAAGCEFVNREYLRFLGCSLDEVRGVRWQEWIHPEDAEAYLTAYRQAVADQRPFEADFRFRRADGEYRWLRSLGVPRFDGGGTLQGYVGCSIDITESKESEALLREADQRKDEFLATLAHELRNPLAPICNSLSVLRLAGSGPIAERVHEMMERQVGQLVRLVDDLLEVSRITRGKLELRRERVDLAAVFQAAVETSKPLIEAAYHRLAISMPPVPLTLEADPVRLAQVFANLLNNAAKYTDVGGRIWVKAWRADNDAVVSIRDDGAGISADLLPRVFEPFTQIDRTLNRAQGGLGIGLTLVRRLVELHGGRVEAKSAGAGEGSEFLVRLPLARDVARDPSGVLWNPLATPVAPRRILVADDNVDAAESLGILLRYLGVEVHVVHDGAAALAAVESFQPAIVILDLGMPGMDGYEVARRIRSEPRHADLQLIAITGWGQPEDEQRSREAGFDHHLVKPVTSKSLQALLA